jgi:beta-carotene 15,15'-dioxygenase
MLRQLLLAFGFLILLWYSSSYKPNIEVQYLFFFSGILLLGVPHGAADLLVATQRAIEQKKTFSMPRFLLNYLARLFLFGLLLWLFPLVGFLLFILFAGYHFGETDLYYFNTKGIEGKLFVTSYGLLILGVILLQHFEDVIPLLNLFDSGKQNIFLIQFLDSNRFLILSILGIAFFASAFLYFTLNRANYEHSKFLIHFAIILIIVYYLPMLLGFTFYFIVWHSILSITNIIQYLRKNETLTLGKIIGQITLYSCIAIAGIVAFGLSGFMFVNNDTIMVYIILGLAVLTAPHMQIMHNMYFASRAIISTTHSQ